MGKKLLVLCVLILVINLALFALPSINDVLSSFPEDLVSSFLEGETIERYSVYGQNVASIAFDGTMGKSKALKDSEKDNVFSMGLSCFVPYPESWEGLSDSEKKLNIINTLLSVSTIKGITYISYSAGEKPKVLFSEAYTLTDKDSNKEAYDAKFAYAPDTYKYQIAAYLKDSVFGGNKYIIDYDIYESEIFMTITNYTNLKLFFFNVAKKGEVSMCVDVLMTKEGLALFAISSVSDREAVVKTPIVEVDLPSAFMRRITSLRDWFVAEINK
ncbi:MAG: DUF6675 family protein [Candidatus Ornithospirochaeta sp.]